MSITMFLLWARLRNNLVYLYTEPREINLLFNEFQNSCSFSFSCLRVASNSSLLWFPVGPERVTVF